MFNITWTLLIQRLLFGRYNNAFWNSFLNALIAPVTYLYGLFQTQSATNIFQLSWNGQTCVLEKLLNDTFDNTERRIYISNTQLQLNNSVFYLTSENQRNPIFPLTGESIPNTDSLGLPNYPYIGYTAADYALEYDFIVNVPAALSYSAAQFNSYLNYYKKASKRYIIKTF